MTRGSGLDSTAPCACKFIINLHLRLVYARAGWAERSTTQHFATDVLPEGTKTQQGVVLTTDLESVYYRETYRKRNILAKNARSVVLCVGRNGGGRARQAQMTLDRIQA
jgi:3-dehydroquinate dehydratase